MNTDLDTSAILIIKLGALGDFIQALGPMKAIRKHHPTAPITLLTTPAFEALARQSGYVDEIWLDERPRIYQIRKWLALRRRLRSVGFGCVYDLQTSDRSSSYFRLFASNAKPQWSGIAKGCSHPHANPDRNHMHTQDRQREQLQLAGIDTIEASDLSWANADLSRFKLPDTYALLIPGGAPHRPAKRWPVAGYAELTAHLNSMGITPVILGSALESGLANEIMERVPQAIDLTGKTSLLEIASLAAKATMAIGNDTGPMHMTAVTGCPSVVLFSNESNPNLCAPRGGQTTIISRQNLADLSAEEVFKSLPLLDQGA